MNMTATNGAQCTNFLEGIHTTKRGIIHTKLFSSPTRICLLDFLGAAEYFITDFGAVWPRNKVYPNRFNKLTRGFLPLVIRDRYFPYQWSLIPTVLGEIWFPINQLLGWCFSPREKIEKAHFFSKGVIFYPPNIDNYHWVSEQPERPEYPSLYLDFMDSLYG